MRTLVFVDLDKTLIDRSYKVSVDDGELLVANAVSKCRDRGIEVGLASDTPLPVLRYWADIFGMTGPIIAELGALYQVNGTTIIDTEPSVGIDFVAARNSLVSDLLKNRPELSLFIGDNTSFVRKMNSGDIKVDFLDRFVLISGLRTRSLAFHCMMIGKNREPMPNEKLLADIVEKARDCLAESGTDLDKVFFDVNSEYGICIARSASASKRKAILDILNADDFDIIFIGDSMGDFIDDSRVKQFAVVNATEDYKKLCSRISEKSTTEGVVELLDSICLIEEQ